MCIHEETIYVPVLESYPCSFVRGVLLSVYLFKYNILNCPFFDNFDILAF
eukprot:SAG11_NODE_400_length_9761_cov_5.916373_5_plen_49_part_01